MHSLVWAARELPTRLGVPPIELVDGEKLVEMLEDLELGFRSVKAFEIDPSFFNEFRG